MWTTNFTPSCSVLTKLPPKIRKSAPKRSSSWKIDKDDKRLKVRWIHKNNRRGCNTSATIKSIAYLLFKNYMSKKIKINNFW